jgi:site-specific DNA-cytosine methylase
LNAFDVGDTRATVLIFAHNAGIDIQASETISPTLKAGHDTMPAIAFDTYNQTTSDVSQTIKAHTANNENIGVVMVQEPIMPTLLAGMSHLTGTTQDGYIEKINQVTSNVRRLTPVECERLQGFPDNWTEGQADSNRYKQMGNAVAVPVVSWIVERLVANA